MKRIKIQSPETKLITIYRVDDAVKAELIKNLLKDHGLAVELGGEHQGGFTGALSVEVIVREQDAKSALDLIRRHFQNV